MLALESSSFSSFFRSSFLAEEVVAATAVAEDDDDGSVARSLGGAVDGAGTGADWATWNREEVSGSDAGVDAVASRATGVVITVSTSDDASDNAVTASVIFASGGGVATAETAGGCPVGTKGSGSKYEWAGRFSTATAGEASAIEAATALADSEWFSAPWKRSSMR